MKVKVGAEIIKMKGKTFAEIKEIAEENNQKRKEMRERNVKEND